VQLPDWFKGGVATLVKDGRVLFVRDGKGTAGTWDPTDGTWRPATGLNKWRSEFAVIALRDGRVLLAGGRNDSDESYSSAYAWEPREDVWTKVGLMSIARAAPSIAMLPDGKVLVAGGYYAYKPRWGMTDPQLGAMLPTTQSGTGLRVRAASLRLPVADVDVPPGGRALATAEIFDPATGEWSTARPMHFARAGAPAVTLADGRILVTGASPANVEIDEHAYDTAEIYDPATGRWSLIRDTEWIPMSELRRQGMPEWALGLATGGLPLDPGTLVALDGGGAVLVGESQWAKHEGEETRSFLYHRKGDRRTEIGTPWLAVWENVPNYRSYTSPGPRWLGAAAVRLPDGRVLVAGGDPDGMEVQPFQVTEARIYEPSTGKWRKAPSTPSALGASQGVLLEDGTVLVIGADGPVFRFYPGR
jgi:hypothetical protein